jgi:hypothetical protein
MTVTQRIEAQLLRGLTVLGVPGVALGVFYLLLRSFNFDFAQISGGWSALIAVLFLLITGGVTLYGLHRWAPNTLERAGQERATSVLLEKDGEIVTYEDLLRSTTHDLVKIKAHSHRLGVRAEYEWIRRNYPSGEWQGQALSTLDLLTDGREYDSSQIHFDVVTVMLPGGRAKQICFDISDFFDGGSSQVMDPEGFLAKRLVKLYSPASRPSC